MERVTIDRHTAVLSFESDIDKYIHDFFDRFTEPDASDAERENVIKNAGQGQFNAALVYAGRIVFRDRDILRIDKGLREKDTEHIYLARDVNNVAYDYIYIYNYIYPIYIQLCQIYDKEVSIHGFCGLLGIDKDNLMSYKGLSNGLSSSNVTRARLELLKSLRAANEDSLSDILVSGKRAPVAILGALNHRHGWSLPGVSKEDARPVALSAAELPKLGGDNTRYIDTNESEEGEKT